MCLVVFSADKLVAKEGKWKRHIGYSNVREGREYLGENGHESTHRDAAAAEAGDVQFEERADHYEKARRLHGRR